MAGPANTSARTTRETAIGVRLDDLQSGNYMGQSSATSGLSAGCPTCGKQHGANSLDQLIQAVRRCCKVKKTKVREILPRPSMPALPLTIVFDRVGASQNESTYAHWSAYNKDKRDWKARCQIALVDLAGLNMWWSRWTLVREYAHPHRELDWANCVGGAKALIDCLVANQVIRDDRPKHFICDYSQRRGEVNQTILTLEEYHNEESNAQT